MIRSLAAALLTAAFAVATAQAGDYPSRPVKIIVPTPPGGVGTMIFTGRLG
jgi:tripartite-type tricarboxylate transporter receptor subunit TctC